MGSGGCADTRMGVRFNLREMFYVDYGRFPDYDNMEDEDTLFFLEESIHETVVDISVNELSSFDFWRTEKRELLSTLGFTYSVFSLLESNSAVIYWRDGHNDESYIFMAPKVYEKGSNAYFYNIAKEAHIFFTALIKAYSGYSFVQPALGYIPGGQLKLPLSFNVPKGIWKKWSDFSDWY